MDPFIFSFFYSIVERANRIARELGARAKRERVANPSFYPRVLQPVRHTVEIYMLFPAWMVCVGPT